jgi:hypothetical protein
MNHKRNEATLKELKTESTLDKISKYKTNWIQHFDRIQKKHNSDTIRKSRTTWIKKQLKTFEETEMDEVETGVQVAQ